MKATFCPFYDVESSLDCWDFSGPKGEGLRNKNGYWNWSDKSTPTRKTGPSEGHTHGYVYIESSRTQGGNIFTMTSKDSFNAKDSEISVSFYYNTNTFDTILLEVFGWNGYRWILECTIKETELEDAWIKSSFKIENYSNDDCRIRFKITLPEGSSNYRDYAIDSISISTSNPDVDSIKTFLENKGINKRNKFEKVFNAKHKTKEEFVSIYDEFKENMQGFNFEKYPDGVVIIEDQNNVHLFREEDK